MDQEERGKLICKDLEAADCQAEWFLDPNKELFLIVDNKWLMRCVGEDEDKTLYWIPVRPTYRSMMLRELGYRKLEYVPLFEKKF